MNQSQRPKRKYTPEFKADVLRLVANGEPIMAVARKMGISDSLIHAWRKGNDKGETKTDQTLQQEVDTLRKQLRQTEMEREILKAHPLLNSPYNLRSGQKPYLWPTF